MRRIINMTAVAVIDAQLESMENSGMSSFDG
jgi:hypothetical protein